MGADDIHDDEHELRWREYRRLIDEAQRHPGYIQHERNEAMSRMIRIMRTNHHELLGILELARTDAEVAMVMASNTMAFASKRDELFSEITRRLLNFLNSAASLVDHVRIIMSDYRGPVAAAHQARVDNFILDGSWPFVRDLRNLAHHVRLPFLGNQTSFGRDASGALVMTNAIVQLDRGDLLRWRGWKSQSEQYLLACPEQIALQPLVHSVGEALGALHAKLHDELQAANEAARREVNEIITRAHAELHGGDLTAARQFLEQTHGADSSEFE